MRWARVSIPSAAYFLTFCTEQRVRTLFELRSLRDIKSAFDTLESSGDAQVLAASIMPDHVHVLLTLGDRLSIGQVMAKFKAISRGGGYATWRWQRDGFEHRLRADESTEDYGFYLFMNPYRAGAIAVDGRWSGWICRDPRRFGFMQHLSAAGTPPSQWLDQSDVVSMRIKSYVPVDRMYGRPLWPDRGVFGV